jgi:hypothetical protein
MTVWLNNHLRLFVQQGRGAGLYVGIFVLYTLVFVVVVIYIQDIYKFVLA